MIALGDSTGDNVSVPVMSFQMTIVGNNVQVQGQINTSLVIAGGGVINLNVGGYPYLLSTPVCPLGTQTYWAIVVSLSTGICASLTSTSAMPVAPAGSWLLYSTTIPTTASTLEQALGLTVSR